MKMQLQKVLNQTKNINALLCEKDKEALYRYAKKVPSGGLIVDIGTAAGGSAFIMALASKPDVGVVTIDPAVNKDFMGNRKLLGLEKKVFFINKTSEAAFKNWGGRKIDMLFIDGVHDYHGVMNDFRTFGSLINKNGIIAIHDIFLYDNTVGMAANEIFESNKVIHVETVDDTWIDGRRVGMMIGVKA